MSIVRNINNQSNISNFSLSPKTFDEAMQYAKLISESDFVPREHKGKAGNVLVAIQYGAELGLSPMQALQNISVISGRPCLWGDALLGLVMSNPNFLDIHEKVENDIATCTVDRKNRDSVTRTFSKEDAKKAGLWDKQGPWKQYPDRMLQLRARTFALRDSFPDALKGLTTREEVEDYSINVKHKIIETKNNEVKLIESDVIENDMDEIDFKADVEKLEKVSTLEELEKVFKSSYKFWVEKRDNIRLKKIIDIKDIRKNELTEEKDHLECKLTNLPVDENHNDIVNYLK